MATYPLGRSIPACAGEPNASLLLIHFRVNPRVCGGAAVRWQSAAGERWVNPRVCGGAVRALLNLCRGQSPRVRGSRIQIPVSHLGERSIPACAGEPIASPLPGYARVNPRVCGGATRSRHILTGRVNPRVCGGADGAGHEDVSAVNPRVCGGAGGVALFAGPWGQSPRVRGSQA
jgi:hypothetical protein